MLPPELTVPTVLSPLSFLSELIHLRAGCQCSVGMCYMVENHALDAGISDMRLFICDFYTTITFLNSKFKFIYNGQLNEEFYFN